MARRRNTAMQRSINSDSGPRRNMNGAGVGGRLVTRRGGTGRAEAGSSMLGSRRQRYGDIRRSLGLSQG